MTSSASRSGRRAAPLLRTSSKTGTRRKVGRTGWASRASDLANARSVQITLTPVEPQLAQLGATPPRGDRWLHEQKFDGYRLTAKVVGGDVRIWTRNAVDWTEKLPWLARSLRQLDLAEGAFDGELVVGAGRPDDFNALQAALAAGTHAGMRFMVFDLLHCDGFDIAGAPLCERKALLQEVLGLAPPKTLAFSTHIEGHGPEVFEQAQKARLEGIVSKRADAPYRPGRGNAWQKTKNVDSEEFAAVGITRKKGQRSGFSSLLLARPTESGWRYAGRVGTGFSQEQLREISQRIGQIGGKDPTAEVPNGVSTDLKDALWFPPLFVVDAFSRGVSGSGVLRHASLKEVRLDKSPDDLRRDGGDEPRPVTEAPRKPSRKVNVIRADLDSGGDGSTVKRVSPRRSIRVIVPEPDETPAAVSKVKATPSAPTQKRAGARTDRARVSSPDKVLFPEDGITKQEVADYYLAVMDRLLPEIQGRPLSVIRCPDGAGGKCFFQKHETAGMKAVDTEKVKPHKGDAGRYLVVRDAAGLMELVQHNALEFHPWGALASDPDRADRVVFDLDPGPGVGWEEVQSSARQIRGYLKDIGLVSYLRTSGGKGLHVVVPLNPATDWDTVKSFAKGFAVALAGAEPDRYVATITLAKRPGKIFVDYLRNGRGATAVASYSLRARPGAPVAMPIGWEELDSVYGGDAFSMSSALRRLRTLRRDPWADINDHHQDLSRWQ
jgi:bifunctional non-homologous end joining protein LigD